MELLICKDGPYAESALASYRNREPFMAVRGVSVVRSPEGRDPCASIYKEQQVWRLDVDVVSDTRSAIREREYAQMAANDTIRPCLRRDEIRMLH
jgi:hypothetical protein